MFYNGDARLVSIMASWTDADVPDSFARRQRGAPGCARTTCAGTMS